jgi:hypothetical protein
MNNQIQELANQAKANVPAGLAVDKWIETYNEKFAELIVRECMSVIELDVKPSFTRQDVYRIRAVVKQHFGVEE